MKKEFIIPVKELQKKDRHLELHVEKTEWLRAMLERSAPAFPTSSRKAEDWAAAVQYSAVLDLRYFSSELQVEGSFQAKCPVLCSRCGEEAQAQREGQIQLFYKVLENYEKFEDSDDAADAHFQYLERPELNLLELLSEQLILTEKICEVPEEEFDGTAHICKDISEFTGQNDLEEAESPFAALGTLKGKLNS